MSVCVREISCVCARECVCVRACVRDDPVLMGSDVSSVSHSFTGSVWLMISSCD